MPKFKVREGFVLKRVDYVKVEDRIEERQLTAYPGETVDLTTEQALEHLHQVEPVDKDAIKFVEARFVPSAELTSVAGGISADVSAYIKQAIAEGIAAGMAASAQVQSQAPAAPAQG